MSFKVGIFIRGKQKDKIEKWLPERYTSHESAGIATTAKNVDLGHSIDKDGCPIGVPLGRRFAMYDNA